MGTMLHQSLAKSEHECEGVKTSVSPQQDLQLFEELSSSLASRLEKVEQRECQRVSELREALREAESRCERFESGGTSTQDGFLAARDNEVKELRRQHWQLVKRLMLAEKEVADLREQVARPSDKDTKDVRDSSASNTAE